MAKAPLTIITNRRGPCSKAFTLRGGRLQKTAAANVYNGLAQRRVVEDLEGLNDIIEGLGSDQALTFGVPAYPKIRIVTQEALARRSGPAIARDREHFSWPKGRGIMFFDVDRPKDGSEPFKAKTFDAMMCDLFPWWDGIARMYRPSASSFIYDAETGEELIGGGSLRVYVFIDKAENIPAVGVAIADKFWRSGLGRIEFSEAGSMLLRCPVDCAVWQPERLDFAGPVVLGPGLKKQQHRAVIVPGGDIKSAAVIDAGPGFADFGAWASNSLQVRMAKSVHRPEEKQRKRQVIEFRADADAAKGADREKARRTHARALLDGMLTGSYALHFTDGIATVSDVLAAPERYDMKRLADPVEPDYAGDSRIAIFFANRGHGRPHIFSHAHGGRKFVLDSHSSARV